MAIVEAIQAGEGAAPGSSCEARRLRVLDPTSRRSVGEFEVADAAAVAAAVARARAAQPAWEATPVPERARVVQRALAIMLERQDEFMDVIIGETGRSRLETFFMEMFATADSMNYYSRHARKVLRDRTVGLHLLRMKRAKIVYKPLGVVGIITPWNGPFVLSLNPTVQALLAGNAVIVKPSEVTPFSGKLVETLFDAAGLPEGLVQVVLGDGETGAALVNADVDKISFTGSVATGRKVGEACGRNLTPVTLELGGKDPMIVLEDADVGRAAGGAVFGAFMNGGQFCSSTERVYVVEPVAEEFIARVVEKTRALTVGASADGDGHFDIGPFIMERQIDVVERHVRDAVSKGAKVMCGGRRRPDLGDQFYEPTVLTDVTHDMAIMTEETFGPVLPIMVCRDVEHAIQMANDTSYGLGSTLWSKDTKKAERIARRMAAGSVCINESSLTYGALEVPFGGRKSSGVGAVNGANGLLGYCYAQPIITDRFGFKEEQVWYPYTKDKYDGMKKALKVMWGSPLRALLK